MRDRHQRLLDEETRKLAEREARLDALGVRPSCDPPEYEPEDDWFHLVEHEYAEWLAQNAWALRSSSDLNYRQAAQLIAALRQQAKEAQP